MQFKVLMGNLSEGDSIGINKQPEMVQVMKLFRETDTDGASPPEASGERGGSRPALSRGPLQPA